MPKAGDLSEANSRLDPFKSFDPAAFIGDDKVPQEICNLVLALALAYNDSKDAVYGYFLLMENRPLGDFQRRPDFGAWAGIRMHIIRYQLGRVFETCKLIQDHQPWINHTVFHAIVQKMETSSKTAWQSFVSAALGQSTADSFERLLARLRNNVLTHYGPEEIFSGYRYHFYDSSSNPKEQALISQGKDMDSSRFYFADAATQGYLELRIGQDAYTFFEQAIGIMRNLNFAVAGLVRAFLENRGFPLRDGEPH